MVEIHVRPDQVALVDDDDAPLVRRHNWSIQRLKGCRTVYAIARMRVGGKRRVITMHRLVMGCVHGDGKFVDHKNRNGLDCRRENLRFADKSQQNANMEQKSSRQPFKGVKRWALKKRPMFSAMIGFQGKSIYLGRFPTAEEAAMRYNVEARKLFGEFACLNEVDMG